MVPENLRYTESHEWVRLEGDTCTIGITQFAVDQLGDLTLVELPKPGKQLKKEAEFGVVESYKSAEDLYSPVDGEVVESNDAVEDDVTILSESPYGEGWLIKVKVGEGYSLDHLLTPDQYQAQIDSEDH